jgi:S-DNA-T family DNA segregation ATPase FtsK/SpoIIIE
VRSRISAVAVDGLAADLVDGVQFDRWCRAAAAEARRDAATIAGWICDLVDEPPPVQVPVPQGHGELTAAIGMHDRALVEVDLERDGPHVLIAGTTGSGKSALLQTLAIGLAARTPPSRLQFLLVDYKGGAAFAGCGRLPHTAGVVTDLDAAGTTRVLGSLRSELRRRERVLAEAGCADLPALRRRVGAEAPPSLVVFVDEFAAMVDASPDVVAGLIDIARRGGRSACISSSRRSGRPVRSAPTSARTSAMHRATRR